MLRFLNIARVFVILTSALEVNSTYNCHIKLKPVHMNIKEYLVFFKAILSSMYLATTLSKFYENFVEKNS